MSSIGVLAEGLEATDTQTVIQKVIEGLELFCVANDETSVASEEAKVLFVMSEVLPTLGISTNIASYQTFTEVTQLVNGLREENNLQKIIPAGDANVTELMNILQEFCFDLKKYQLLSAEEKIRKISRIATENFKSQRNLSQKIVFSKFIIFSHIFMQCLEGTESCVSLTTLSKQSKENIANYIKSTIKSLMDSIKRKSNSFFTGSSKSKSQDLVDDILHNVYPAYSVCQDYTQPYKVDILYLVFFLSLHYF